MNRITGYWAFGLLALLTVVMGLATWTEHKIGSHHAYMLFYNSFWFSLLWFLMAAFALYYIVDRKLYRRLSVAALHFALLLILAGALTTRLTGRTGQIRLRENTPTASFTDDRRNDTELPFTLTLKSFSIEYYPGTSSPSNYISIVEIDDIEHKISMNHILNHLGYRFYQASFDEDMHGSVLSVNHDVWGIRLSYSGYFLLFFSMLFVLFDRKERFRFLLRKLSAKTSVIICLLMMSYTSAKAQDFTPEQCAEWNRVWVEYNGRICPLQTVANDFTVKLTGKERYRNYSSMQVFLGWLFAPERWQYEPIFEIKSREMQQLTGRTGFASFTDFIDKNGYNKLEPYYREIYGGGKQDALLKEIMKTSDKMHLVEMLHDGSLLKIFPMSGDDGRLQWMSPNMRFPVQKDSTDMHFAIHFISLYYKCIQQDDAVNASMYLSKLQLFQQKKAGEFLPSPVHLETELLYNRLHLFDRLFKFCLTVGFICLFFFILSTIRKRSYPLAEGIFHILLWVFFIAETFGLGLRTYISGSIPVSNGYETMLLLSWLSLLTGLLVRRYSSLFVVFSFLLSGFTLLVAHISSMNPHITPLMPVLQSPLLNIHVLLIMVSYGLCGFMALNAITALTINSFKKDSMYLERMKEISELFMYPATFLMGAGIFIGAIWANISWGRYWGWDPKEVWALITFLLMGFTFHSKTLKFFNNPVIYHIFTLIILLSVLMTYFGVNFILGGRHSYGG
jgi:ABC-type transport system involved in cytochrome c biogenesis permease subunit